MKHILSAIIAILLFAMPVKAQQVTADSLYLQAYTEIADMLDGKQPLSIKRAVFLSEWAYLGGRLDYQRDFCDEISRIANYIRNVIALNHFETYKTSKEFSICNYFFLPCNGNGRIPYTYDYNEEYKRGDWRHQFVSRTLKNHKGQCHSLPMTFKLIAEELGAKAYIAQSPRHSYIMYKDEDDHYPGDWVNVELTSHQYVPSFYIKEHYMISDSAVLAGTYMTPMTDVQTIANQLTDLPSEVLAGVESMTTYDLHVSPVDMNGKPFKNDPSNFYKGYTQTPVDPDFPSSDGNVHVFMSSLQAGIDLSLNFGHEVLSHALFYEMGLPFGHEYEFQPIKVFYEEEGVCGFDLKRVDNNTQLNSQINRIQKIIRQNFNSRK